MMNLKDALKVAQEKGKQMNDEVICYYETNSYYLFDVKPINWNGEIMLDRPIYDAFYTVSKETGELSVKSFFLDIDDDSEFTILYDKTKKRSLDNIE